uniref:Ring finger protein 181 n=1 Tax=Prolemur simus TaxID=1328070 RepID=A0A8C9AJD1_PROSS
MASYFDEHDCEPLDPEQETRAGMLLELARSLFHGMDFEDLGLVVDWDHHLPPPAAKTAVENLPRTVIRGSQAGDCPKLVAKGAIENEDIDDKHPLAQGCPMLQLRTLMDEKDTT